MFLTFVIIILTWVRKQCSKMFLYCSSRCRFCCIAEYYFKNNENFFRKVSAALFLKQHTRNCWLKRWKCGCFKKYILLVKMMMCFLNTRWHVPSFRLSISYCVLIITLTEFQESRCCNLYMTILDVPLRHRRNIADFTTYRYGNGWLPSSYQYLVCTCIINTANQTFFFFLC